MQQRYPGLLDDTGEKDAERQPASLGGVAIMLLLLVVGLFLIREMHANDAIEDGLLAGRMNDGLLVATLF
jgi:hypothetical protein